MHVRCLGRSCGLSESTGRRSGHRRLRPDRSIFGSLGSRLCRRGRFGGTGPGSGSGHLRRFGRRDADRDHRAGPGAQGVIVVPGRNQGHPGRVGRSGPGGCHRRGAPRCPRGPSFHPDRWALRRPSGPDGVSEHRYHPRAAAGHPTFALSSIPCEPASSAGHSTRSTSPISTLGSAPAIRWASTG